MAIVGEFDRIDRHFKPLAAGFEGALELSDDAALVAPPVGESLVLTTDAMVEGVHYLPGEDPGRLARKALRVNLSDLAAMGARPLVYLLTTALPKAVEDDWLSAFAEGLRQDQDRFGVHLAGGDSVATPGPPMISITAIGTVPEGRTIRRSGTRPGDRVWVSGTIGDGVLGLQAARGGLDDLPEPDRDYLAGRYHLPTPRVELGQRLRGLATAAADVSDGLMGDLGHICAASGVGAKVVVETVPLSTAARAAAGLSRETAALAIAGGDDYELVFTAAPKTDRALAELADELECPLTRVGEIIAGNAVMPVTADGRPMTLPDSWQHFQPE